MQQGRRTYGPRAQNGAGKDFLCTRHSVLSQILISFPRPASLRCEHVFIYTQLTVQRLCMNYRCYQITLRVKHFYTNRSGAKF